MEFETLEGRYRRMTDIDVQCYHFLDCGLWENLSAPRTGLELAGQMSVERTAWRYQQSNFSNQRCWSRHAHWAMQRMGAVVVDLEADPLAPQFWLFSGPRREAQCH